MALDVLVVGGFAFTDFAVPDNLPAGGAQSLKVWKQPGGERKINAAGPDDRDRSFSGRYWGSDALENAQTLDALRRAGSALPYSNGVESRVVVISHFDFELVRFNCIEYQITLVLADNPGSSSQPSSISSLVSSDQSAAQGILDDDAADNSGGIGSDANIGTSIPSATPFSAGIGMN